MGRWRNLTTGAVVSVDDSKDDRFGAGWESADTEAPVKKAPVKKAAAKRAAAKPDDE